MLLLVLIYFTCFDSLSVSFYKISCTNEWCQANFKQKLTLQSIVLNINLMLRYFHVWNWLHGYIQFTTSELWDGHYCHCSGTVDKQVRLAGNGNTDKPQLEHRRKIKQQGHQAVRITTVISFLTTWTVSWACFISVLTLSNMLYIILP